MKAAPKFCSFVCSAPIGLLVYSFCSIFYFYFCVAIFQLLQLFSAGVVCLFGGEKLKENTSGNEIEISESRNGNACESFFFLLVSLWQTLHMTLWPGKNIFLINIEREDKVLNCLTISHESIPFCVFRAKEYFFNKGKLSICWCKPNVGTYVVGYLPQLSGFVCF